MHREREYAWVTLEDCRRAVALVDIEVDDQGPGCAPLSLQHADGDGNVVQHAEALAVIGKRVVGAARQVARHAVFQCSARSFDRSLHRQLRPAPERRRPRDADAADLGRLQRPRREFLQVPGRMNKREVAGWRFVGDEDVLRLQHPLAEQPLVRQRVLGHGKRVPRRQRNEVVGVVCVAHGEV